MAAAPKLTAAQAHVVKAFEQAQEDLTLICTLDVANRGPEGRASLREDLRESRPGDLKANIKCLAALAITMGVSPERVKTQAERDTEAKAAQVIAETQAKAEAEGAASLPKGAKLPQADGFTPAQEARIGVIVSDAVIAGITAMMAAK